MRSEGSIIESYNNNKKAISIMQIYLLVVVLTFYCQLHALTSIVV